MSLDITLWIASGNAAKSRELVDLAGQYLSHFKFVRVRPARSAEETEATYAGNAAIKARALVQELLDEGHKNFAVLGDDSGLSVDLLGGRPGIFSARYSGAESNSARHTNRVIEDLAKVSFDLSDRKAKYHCALNLVEVRGATVIGEYAAEGVRDGLIGFAPIGIGGYAYDSIFLDPHTLKSYSEISYDEKQRDSHRTRAFAALQSTLDKASAV